jgi:nitrogenase subunit NifH
MLSKVKKMQKAKEKGIICNEGKKKSKEKECIEVFQKSLIGQRK